MKIKIIDNWEVELTNDRGDTLTLKGEWYVDFFKEYENKQLIIANVAGRSEQYHCELYDFGRQNNPCSKQCEGCKVNEP